MNTIYIFKIIVAILLGSAIGFERESYERQVQKMGSHGRGSLGVRSYALISLLGVLSGFIYEKYLIFFILIASTFFLLLLGYYILGSLFNHDVGITTELAIIINFIFSICLGSNIFPTQLIIALTVVVILIMSQKSEIKTLVAKVRDHELDAFISFALIALVILPFLPNKSFTLNHISGISSFFESFHIPLKKILDVEIINPFSLWRIIVIITGIDLIGYLFEKTIGQKNSWLLTSIAGGFISSTSTTQSLAIRSTKSKNINGLVAAAIFSNFSSFIQHFFLIASINSALLVTGLPYLISILITSLIIGIIFHLKSKKINQEEMNETKKTMQVTKIFSLKPALSFALIFTLIKLFSKISLVLFNQQAFLITTTLASLTGMDAVTLSIGEIAGKNVNYFTAISALIFANAVNLLAKTFYSFTQGKRSFAIKFGLSSLIIITASLLSLLFQK